jgi:acylphosphatase
MRQVNLLISGSVQGVGFRNFVAYNAKKMGVTGWVRNLSDKRVEILAQGNEDILRKFIEICERGPFTAEVKNVALDWQESEEIFIKFDKKPTA